MSGTEFRHDFIKGQKAVDVIMAYCTEHKIFYRIATKKEQHNDIDLYIKDVATEIKLMSYHDKVCVEETGSSASNGWIVVSKAKKIIFVYTKDEAYDFVYIVDLKELRDLYTKIGKNYRLHHNGLSTGEYGDTWTSSFKFIPLYVLKQYIKVKEIKI